jgi:hypothetical protein
MKKMSHWGKPIALLTLGLSAVGGLNAPAPAVSSTTTANSLRESQATSVQRQGNFQLAQSIVGQCRAAGRRIFVYSQRSTSSRTVRTLAPNEQVTLADDGAVGWVAISSPEPGYVRASELISCPVANRPTPTPTPSATPSPTPSATPSPTPQTTSLCRIVTYNGPEGGLAIRSQPDRSAPRVNGVKFGDRVTLRTSPPPTTLDKDGRDWLELTAPTPGWISNGFPNSRSANTAVCP